MTAWTDNELHHIGEAEELELASRLRPWYLRARASGVGRIRAGGLERDVTFADEAADVYPAIDAAYHAKYDQYGPEIVGTVVGPNAKAVTVRLLPQRARD